MNAHKELAIRALEQMKGDDLYRARAAFRGLPTEQMQKQHGQSGKTRAQILAEYEAHDQRVNAAIAWVQAAPEKSAFEAAEAPGPDDTICHTCNGRGFHAR